MGGFNPPTQAQHKHNAQNTDDDYAFPAPPFFFFLIPFPFPHNPNTTSRTLFEIGAPSQKKCLQKTPHNTHRTLAQPNIPPPHPSPPKKGLPMTQTPFRHPGYQFFSVTPSHNQQSLGNGWCDHCSGGGSGLRYLDRGWGGKALGNCCALSRRVLDWSPLIRVLADANS